MGNNLPAGYREEDTCDCPQCNGTGNDQWQDEIQDCEFCDGTGTVDQSEADHWNFENNEPLI